LKNWLVVRETVSSAHGKWFFSSPHKADIAVFDDCNLHILVRAINPDLSITVFNQRPPEIWLGLGVLGKLCSVLYLMKWSDIAEHPQGKLRGILRQFKRLYFLACMKVIRPKAVVTIIDNSSTFGWLAKHCRDFPFIAIQNGSRLAYAISTEPPVYHQHLFCFGEHEMKHLPANGWNVEHFYPVGSLLASLYFSHPPEIVENRFDVLLASSWRGNIGFQTDVQDTMASMETLDKLLAGYLSKRKLKAAVILRSERDSEHWFMPEIGKNEAEYYQSIYGNKIEIIETSSKDRNIFSLMEASELVVACLTSALIEALGIGKKVQFFNFTGKKLYHQDFKPELVFSDPEPDAFARKMDELLAMNPWPQLQYFQKIAKHYMSIDPQIPTYKIIASQIDKIIEGKKVHA
jgi:hypothetical protein